MDVKIKGRNIPVTEALEAYAREKVERAARFFDDEGSASRVEVELLHERNPSIPQPEVADATLFVDGTVMKAREASADMYASIDLMADKLMRQVRRYRGRQLDRWQGQRGRRAGQTLLAGAEAVEEGEDAGDLTARIVRTKQFQMKPMGAEEAAMNMELLDHDFFVFTSAETGDINVLYRRRDGDFGLIEPAR